MNQSWSEPASSGRTSRARLRARAARPVARPAENAGRRPRRHALRRTRNAGIVLAVITTPLAVVDDTRAFRPATVVVSAPAVPSVSPPPRRDPVASASRPASRSRRTPAARPPGAAAPRRAGTPPLAPRAALRPSARATAHRVVYRVETLDGPVYHGDATWYGPGFHGRLTASGERFDTDNHMTAAHRWLPFGTKLRVCTTARCVVVRVNDRGPFGEGRIVDLSRLAARRLGIVYRGVAPVTVTVLEQRRLAFRMPGPGPSRAVAVVPPTPTPARPSRPGSGPEPVRMVEAAALPDRDGTAGGLLVALAAGALLGAARPGVRRRTLAA